MRKVFKVLVWWPINFLIIWPITLIAGAISGFLFGMWRNQK